jgi:Skp family chaperone for outer membrane proteins
VKTVENNMRVLQTGVIELEKVTESIDRAEEANLKLIEGCKAAQEKLQEMSRTIADRSAAASARTAAAARSSQAEVTEMIGSLSGANLPTRTH